MDIINAISDADRYRTEFKYRIGTIILHRTKDDTYDVVDGQQRIISLVLLKRCLEPKLMEAVSVDSAEKATTGDARWRRIESFLKEHETVTNADLRTMFDVSPATANRILAKHVEEGKLQKLRIGKTWGYCLR